MRREFTEKTKRLALERANGMCECGCGQPLQDDTEYHHIVSAWSGGDNSLKNCAALRFDCHRDWTEKFDKPGFHKHRRIVAKSARADKPRSRPMAGTKASGIRKRMNGTVERRDRD
jgi:5-methylcytosine-specific restriction endonuclease McrA